MGLLNTDINERLVLMKAKTKKENKSSTPYWSAFDEGVWGPIKLCSLLDEFCSEASSSYQVINNLKHFCHQKIPI